MNSGDKMNEKPDFENKDFWIFAIRRMVAKRMLKRNHAYPQKIKDVTNLSWVDINNIIRLHKTFITGYDGDKRERYMHHYRSRKYEDWECKRVVDLNEIDIYEICEGKGQSYRLDLVNIAEAKWFEVGERVAKNLALIEMTDLGYSKGEIERILGDDKTQFIYFSSIMLSKEVTDKMENHFTNMGINSKRYRILLDLLQMENNPENASRITGLSRGEIDEFITENAMFESDDEDTVLDSAKIKREMHLWNCELLVECIAVDGLEDYQIEDYSRLSGIDEDYFKRIHKLYGEFKDELHDLLEQMAFNLMDKEVDWEEIEEITGQDIYWKTPSDYYFKKYKDCLRDEYMDVMI